MKPKTYFERCERLDENVTPKFGTVLTEERMGPVKKYIFIYLYSNDNRRDKSP